VTCDWGDCDDLAVSWRLWDRIARVIVDGCHGQQLSDLVSRSAWLPVCARHAVGLVLAA
jgi:hypothetical protein